eukprot:TRINITY_DN322_c0_g1_i1.p1 TRINITY_DN322_c0_g1~~TRINITY_DN322_c0_g1_i1.p1  ORF type:complete len:345 (+),score=43.98 TRINITY_DN322_c0_g1_i1:108-1142(+)
MTNPISPTQIDELAKSLKDVLETRKIAVESVADTIDLVNLIVAQTRKLEFLAADIGKELEKEREELKTFARNIAEISSLSVLSKRDLNQDESVMLFAKGQSIVDNKNQQLLTNSTILLNKKINTCLNELTEIMLRKNIDMGYPADNEKPVAKNEAYPKMRAGLKFAPPPRKNCAVLDTYSIKKIVIDAKNPKKCASTLLSMDKKCERCLISTQYALILGLNCIMCIKCIKEIALNSKKFLYNTYQAQKNRRKAICVCPVHGSPISPQILLKLLGADTVEKASIYAVKSQLNEGRGHPIICTKCKGLVRDSTNPKEAVKFCTRHSVCMKCFRYCNTSLLDCIKAK